MINLSKQHIATIKDAAKKLTGATRREFQAQVSIDYLNSKPHLAEKICGWDRKTVTLTRVTLEWAKTMTWKGVCPVLKLLETTYQSRYDLQYPPNYLRY